MDRQRRIVATNHLSSLLDGTILEETPLNAFRSELVEAVRQVVATCTTTTSIRTGTADNHHDIEKIDCDWIETSMVELNWDATCQKHDALQESSSTATSATSALEELLFCFRNPIIWPSVCHAGLIKALIRILLRMRRLSSPHPRTLSTSATTGLASSKTSHSGANRRRNWRPSSKHLWAFVLSLLQHHPALHTLDYRQNTIRPILLRSSALHSSTAATIDLTLSLTKDLLREFPNHRLRYAPILWETFCAMELLLCQIQQSSCRMGDADRRESSNHSHKRSKSGPRPSHNIDMIHGDLSDTEEERYFRSMSNRALQEWPAKHGRYSSSRKRVYEAQTSSIVKGKYEEQISKLLALRSKAFKSFLTILCHSSYSNLSMRSSLFQSTVEFLVNTPISSGDNKYVRLCALALLASIHAESQPVARTLMHQLWTLCETSEHFGGSYLSFFVELLIESAQFDDETDFSRAVEPLFGYLFDRLAEDSTTVERTRMRMFVVLQSLSFLLLYRGAMLQKVDNFQLLMAQLSVVFPHPLQWLPIPSLSSKQRDKLLDCLEGSGVFGCTVDETTIPRQATGSELKHDAWFFDPSQNRSVRACQYLKGMPAHLLSTKREEGVVSSLAVKKGTDVCFPLDSLGDDLLREIFSFLGYKRMVFNRIVSKRWREISDDEYNTWMPLYCSRFGVHTDDPALKTADTVAWKDLFIQRWRAEREIRFQTDRNGWKWRICNRINCLEILTTRKRWLNHKESHNRKRLPSKRKRSKSKSPTQS